MDAARRPNSPRDLERAPGEILILGVGGTMGPTLAAWRSARRPHGA